LCLAGLRKGFLYKKKKVDNVWQSRFFVLDSDSLTYYKKISVSGQVGGVMGGGWRLERVIEGGLGVVDMEE